MEDSSPDFITSINSLLLLVDYQSFMIRNIGSGDRSEIMNSAVASAKAASLLKVPVIMTSINEEENGQFVNDLSGIFQNISIINRNYDCYDVFRDERMKKLIRKQSRTKLIIGGLWTSVSFIETAIHGVKEGYDVFGLIDACGDMTHDKHNLGVNRMLRSGITPITWMSLASEWMNGWADPTIGELSEEVYGKYNAMLSYLAKH